MSWKPNREGRQGAQAVDMFLMDRRCCRGEGRRTATLIRHPEVRAKRASKDAGPSAEAVALRGPLRGHLRVTE